jgi:dihydroorotate dehydrogenase electron transfer subunit
VGTTPAVRSQYEARVTANQALCREHFRLVLQAADFPATSPGQFIQILCRPVDSEEEAASGAWTGHNQEAGHDPDLVGRVALLRRPFSLAGRADVPGGAELEIIHRVVGVGTEWLGELAVGDMVGILGPLGNRFTLPTGGRPAILVGGGVGIPPMLYLAQALAGRPAVAFSGAVTGDLLPLTLTGPSDRIIPRMNVAEFAAHGIPAVISTDDGSVGFKGYVTRALEDYLDNAPPHKPVIYTCGPELMMKRVAEIANERGLECQIAVERAMACGMGTCQSCCIKVRASGRADGRDWIYRLACTDGPIFRAADLLW